MSESWYYVDGSERAGPVEQSEIERLFQSGNLNAESFVWKKGFENWEKISERPELDYLVNPKRPQAPSIPSPISEIPPLNIQEESFNWAAIKDDDQVIMIRVGHDRGVAEAEYGPFSFKQIEQAFEEKRINEKTYIFISGMPNWEFLGDTPFFDKINNGGMPPKIEESDRRLDKRKPFVARLFFHNSEQVYEGICRDISVGGLQVLVSGYPGVVGESVSMNVHPNNTDFHFVASGQIVRVLEGGQGFSLRFDGLSPEAKDSIDQYITTA